MSEIESELIEQIKAGKKKVVSRLEYLLIYWVPIVAVIGTIFWFAEAKSRMFSTEDMKWETEKNTVMARERTFEKLDQRYVQTKDFDEFKEMIKELNKNILDLKIELAKAR